MVTGHGPTLTVIPARFGRISGPWRGFCPGIRPREPVATVKVVGLFETIADRRIAAARKAGLFDNLPGAGKPIADLDRERPPGWWATRAVKSERDLLRYEELQRMITTAMPGLWRLPDEAAVGRRVAELNRAIDDHNVVAKTRPVDRLQPDEILARWHRVRSAGR